MSEIKKCFICDKELSQDQIYWVGFFENIKIFLCKIDYFLALDKNILQKLMGEINTREVST